MATKAEIDAYVKQIHEAKKIEIIPRDINKETRFRLGITWDDMKSLVRSLETKDCIKQNLIDKDSAQEGVLWVFKKQAYGETLYIKTKIIQLSKNVKVISCHIDNIEV